MKYFYVKPEIYKCKSFKEFLKEFNIGKEDLLLVSKTIFDSYIKHVSPTIRYIHPENYGSGEPDEDMINGIIRDAKAKNYKRVIAVGGGDILDIGKLLALRYNTSCAEILDSSIVPVKDKELILIPTTCGSGSEMTFYSSVRLKGCNSSMIFYSTEFFADNVVLIPELLNTLSYRQFLLCSIETLVHASEAFVSPRSNSYTDFFSYKAVEIILSGFLKLIEKGHDFYVNLLEDFLMASNYAGIAFGNTGLGIVQALSYPLSWKYNVPHGEANYEFFTEVFKKYTVINPSGKIKLLNNSISELLQIQNNDYLYQELQNMLNEFYPKKNAREYGMIKDDVQEFSNLVVKEHKRLLVNNYANLVYKDFVNFYKAVY